VVKQQIPKHPIDDELEQYCLGGLTEAGQERLEEHFLLCEACRGRLVETESFLAAMREAGRQWRGEHAGETGKDARRSWGPWRPNRMVPVFAVAALLVWAAVWTGRHSSAPARLPFAVQLTAMRGGVTGGHAPAGRPLLLNLDSTGLGSLERLGGEIVDSSGSRVAQFRAGQPPRIEPLPPGAYFVRIRGTSGELLREYALTIQP